VAYSSRVVLSTSSPQFTTGPCSSTFPGTLVVRVPFLILSGLALLEGLVLQLHNGLVFVCSGLRGYLTLLSCFVVGFVVGVGQFFSGIESHSPFTLLKHNRSWVGVFQSSMSGLVQTDTSIFYSGHVSSWSL